MNAFGRLEAAKEAAVAVCEFCEACGIPTLIYGDTADRSPREKNVNVRLPGLGKTRAQ